MSIGKPNFINQTGLVVGFFVCLFQFEGLFYKSQLNIPVFKVWMKDHPAIFKNPRPIWNKERSAYCMHICVQKQSSVLKRKQWGRLDGREREGVGSKFCWSCHSATNTENCLLAHPLPRRYTEYQVSEIHFLYSWLEAGGLVQRAC